MKKILIIIFMILIAIPNCYALRECAYEYIKEDGTNCKVIIDRGNTSSGNWVKFFNKVANMGSENWVEGDSCAASIQWLAPYSNVDGDNTFYFYEDESCSTICYSQVKGYVLHSKGAYCQSGETTLYPINNVNLDPSSKYNDVKVCHGQAYEYIQECGCVPAALTDITSRLYFLLKIAAPALLIIIGGFELIKAMSAQDEKAIKKSQTKLVKKLIAAATIFVIFTLVQFLVSILSSNPNDTLTCVRYFIDGYVA